MKKEFVATKILIVAIVFFAGNLFLGTNKAVQAKGSSADRPTYEPVPYPCTVDGSTVSYGSYCEYGQGACIPNPCDE